MISHLMLYAIEVALLIGLAGLALERVAAWGRFPRRVVWAACLVVSLGLPAVNALMPRQAMRQQPLVTNPSPPLVATSPALTQSFQQPETTTFKALPDSHRLVSPTRVSGEEVLSAVWLAASTGLVTLYAFLRLRLRRAARYWRCERINDQEVWLTRELGPAVCGLIKPVIVMPQWVLEAPRHARALILAHEQEHIAARDPALLLLGLVAIVIAPWNLPLWWQLRRLRFAIEVDCDGRVLHRGEEAKDYGEVLLAVGARQSLMPIGAIAGTDGPSQLLRRIRIMTGDLPGPGRWSVGAAVGSRWQASPSPPNCKRPRFGSVRRATKPRR